MLHTELGDILSYAWIKDRFGGDMVFKGIPNAARNGNSLSVPFALAIAQSSSNIEAAWIFVRTFLDRDWQYDNSMGFPTNVEAFQQRARGAMETDYGQSLNQADVDHIFALIDAASGLTSIDSTIWSIVSEDASDYFNGLCSVQDATRFIQSRVSIYLSERS